MPLQKVDAMPDLTVTRSRFQAQLAELLARQVRIGQDLSEPPDRDWDELAVEMEDDDSLAGESALVEREIASVKRALTRIDDGTYGTCVRCAGDIAPARLEARPEAALCIDCARQVQDIKATCKA
jgi:RNA polymerase-binding transcription factor DksA